VNITIFGKTGTGKSVFAARVIDGIRKDIPVYMITDNANDFNGLYDVSIDLDYSNYRYANIERILDEKRIRLVFTMMTDKEVNDFMDRFSSTVYERGVPCVITIDEAHMIYGKRSHSLFLERIVRGGRKKNIHLIMITQQIVDLDLSIIKQSKYVVVFRLTELNDVLRTSENIQIDKDILLSLPLYYYVIYNAYDGTMIEGKEELN